MLPTVGTLVFIGGNQAAIVIGYEVDPGGNSTGGLYVATFAAVETVEAGNYGMQPSLAPENAPSVRPETETVQPTAGSSEPIVPTAGGTNPAPVPVPSPAPAPVLETETPVVPGTVDVGPPGLPADREESQDEQIARLQRELDAVVAQQKADAERQADSSA